MLDIGMEVRAFDQLYTSLRALLLIEGGIDRLDFTVQITPYKYEMLIGEKLVHVVCGGRSGCTLPSNTQT
jgi:hypothetical protein